MTSRRTDRRSQRDLVVTTFTLILERLLDSTACARGAVLVDGEGECVDYSGDLDPYELKVAAATWNIVMSEFGSSERLPPVLQIVVRARKNAFVVRRIHDEYSLVLVLHRYAGFAVSERALQEAETLIRAEAGFEQPALRARWTRVDVETEPDDDQRPRTVRGIAIAPVEATDAPPSSESPRRLPSTGQGWARIDAHERAMRMGWQPVEVMGSLVGLKERERGFRIRLPTGAEMTLVCERQGYWFVDERLET